MANTGLAIRTFAEVTSEPPVIPGTQPASIADFCYCSVNECEYEETVFFDAADNDAIVNDFSSFLYAKTTSTDTCVFKLFKAGEEVADLNDNALGTYYASFTVQPDYVGFVLDWRKVGLAHGAGLFTIKTVVTIAGIDATFESRVFRLQPFSPDLAHGTFKLKTFQNGNILSSEIDFTGLVAGGWPSDYRLTGNFGRRQIELTTDNYQTSSYKIEQIQDSVAWKYTAETKFLPEGIARIVSGESILSDRIICTGYSLKDQDQYKDISVTPENITTKRPEGSISPSYLIEFGEKNQNRIKRRF